MSALALSVLLSFVSAVAYAGGAIVQEHVAVSSPDRQYAPLRRPGWWAAVALNGLGGLLHVVALAYGPLSLVQPLGALTIVFALPMAALFVGRRAGSAAWRGAIMATVGLAGLLSLVGASQAQSLSTAQRVTAAVVSGGAVVTLMIAGRAAHRHPAVRSMLLATASGVAFGMSSVFTKTVAVDWAGGRSLAELPTLVLIGVFATAGVLLSQASYRGAGLAAPLATLTVVNPVVAAAVGITMFGETFRYGSTGTALALSCGVVAAGGLILLTTERMTRTAAETEAPLPEPRLPEPPLPEPAVPVPAQPAPVRPVLAEPVPVEPVPAEPLVAEPVVAVPVFVRPLPAEELLAVLPEQSVPALREDITLEEAPAAAPSATDAPAATATADDAVVAVAEGAEGAEGADDTAAGSRYHGPFYGGAYIPMLPVLPVRERRRERVRS
ncbi:DMT family transporter [Streptomyces sp. NPDC020996]|uniref:DMT family transporter n=1 Tax=Streptomyces sp. NPDC020996 TaxID=3154791 RepID=UPI0033E77696